MTKIKYAFKADPKKTAKSSIKNEKVSHKDAIEICKFIKGMKINNAIKYLTAVIELKKAIPYKRFNKDQAHRKGIGAGKYPKQTSTIIIKLLKNIKNNADNKGLDPDKLKIINAQANKGVVHYRGARMFGRRYSKSANINIIAEEIL
jgi:large subunit ribosomal protein L22